MRIRIYFLLTISSLLISSCVRSTDFHSSQNHQNSDNQYLTNSPEDNIARLAQGNKRFITNQALHPHQSLSRATELATAQKPFAIILSCSDSRVPPEVIFDQGIGDLFVIRTAGQVPDTAGLASIEYAVEHLGVNTLVVLGHESCGAVKAAMATPAGKTAGSPSLDSLIGTIKPHISNFLPGNPGDPDIRGAVSTHVDQTAAELFKSSPILKEFAEQKRLLLAKGIYSLTNSSVTFWDQGYPEIQHNSVESLAHMPEDKNHPSADPALKK